MKNRKPRKPRRGVSRSGCRRIAKILIWTPTRPEAPCRQEVQDK
jgi:hypothetical protein